MFLRRVQVENFRAIRRLDLHLGWSSVLIGENDSGKTSLVDALALCLGSDAGAGELGFTLDDLHRPSESEAAAERLSIVLEFGESEAGEFGEPRFDAVRRALVRSHDERQVVRLEVFARRSGAEELESGARWLDAAGAPLSEDDRAALAVLRREVPLVVLRGGLVYGARVGELRAFKDDSLRADAEVVGELYRRVVGARAQPSGAELERAFAAARSLALRRAGDGELPAWLTAPAGTGGAAHPGSAPQPGRAPHPGGAGHPRSRHARGLGAERLGLLLFVGAMLEAWGSPGPDPLARPILVIEDPEAHLHPMTLASVWSILEGTRLQTLVTTHSSELVSDVPLRALRRLVRTQGEVETFRLRSRTLDEGEARKVRYHVRARHGAALFARCWLLVEGETEFWLLPELARLCGHDFRIEGVACVEFAQCGVAPLVKLARDLGIEWHLVADGDEAGASYERTARAHLGGASAREHISRIPADDMERYLWEHGYADVYTKAALGHSPSGRRAQRAEPGPTIARAVQRRSKPELALDVLEAIGRQGSPGVPRLLRTIAERAARLARGD